MCAVFFNVFGRGQVRENPSTLLEKASFISKIAKFESDLSKKLKFKSKFVPPHQTNICKFLELYLCLLKTYLFQTWPFY